MTNREVETNKVIISGIVGNRPEFSHEVSGERFYIFDLISTRTSGTEDIIPVMVSERLCSIEEIEVGKELEIIGQYRSYNKHEKDRNRLVLSVFALNIDEVENTSDDKNEVILDGYICKAPIYRKTPLGRKIADLLIAVNRPYGKSDYIPCIVWGRNSRYVSTFEVGEHITLQGRIQSREYNKKVDEGMIELRVAYEVSVQKLRKENGDE